MVVRLLAKEKVEGSIPFFRSRKQKSPMDFFHCDLGKTVYDFDGNKLILVSKKPSQTAFLCFHRD